METNNRSNTGTFGQVEQLVPTAAWAAAIDSHDTMHRCLVSLANEPARLVDSAVAQALDTMLTDGWQRGWQPADVNELARRRIDPPARSLLRDAIAATHRQYSSATIDPRWQAQLDQLDLEVWWDPAEPHLSQWARRTGMDRRSALQAMVELAALLLCLPRLPPLIPIPGTAASPRSDPPRSDPPRFGPPRPATPGAAGSDAGAGADRRVLHRVRALLAKAESTDFPEEAETLSAKAQELMAKHALDHAMVEAAGSATSGTDHPTGIRIWLDAPYVSAKSQLVHAVAQANRCRAVFISSVGFCTVLGHLADLELVEVLVTSLLLQANRAMLAQGRPASSGPSRTRSFRQAFLLSYAVRIGERLQAATEASEAAVSEADPQRLLPVLAAREERVEAFVNELFPRLVGKTITVSNDAGWTAGRRAADLAVLRSRTAVED